MTTAKIDHKKRNHALLSASGANRWINCTPSARLEDEYGEKSTSSFAEEGTLAHELSELYIKYDVLSSITEQQFNDNLENIMSNSLFSDEMLDFIPMYVDYISNEAKAAKTEYTIAIVEIEQNLDLSQYVPESHGTADCVIIKDSVLEVIDLKYGKGVPVYAVNNTQLMLYGLGALSKYDCMFDISDVRLTIIQPRLNNISSWDISVEDLKKWAENTLKPAAEKAYNGEGQLVCGDWCRFCSVKNRCKTLAEEQLKIVKYEFKTPELLSDDEISDILQRVPKLVEWANSIHSFAQSEAINNNKVWPGFKLVEGISRRKWLDEDEVAAVILSTIPGATKDRIFDMKLKSITEVEKIFGKKLIADKLSDVIVKPKGKPTLVPLSDKRPALGIEEAINEFS